MIQANQRPTVDLVIPIQKDSKLLEGCVAAIEKHTQNFNLHICRDPDMNVGESRQNALNTLQLGRFVCFLDDDTLIQHDGWLEVLVEALMLGPKLAIAFAEEQWGDDFVLNIYKGRDVVPFGPAACMLIDRDKIPISVRWDKYMGLRTGWLGGDFEEVDYCHQVRQKGLICVGVHGSRFKHLDRTVMSDFVGTDRHMTCQIMAALINYKFQRCPNNKDFFRKLKYVKASETNDRMLAPGATLKEAFDGVIKENGLTGSPVLQRFGLV